MLFTLSVAVATPIQDAFYEPESHAFDEACADHAGFDDEADFRVATNVAETHGLETCAVGERCLQKVELDAFPNATCSDGSPGVFYVRPGVGLKRHNWVIYLQGGGKCQDYESCVDRWCGLQGIYHAGKMSSHWNAGTKLLDEASSEGLLSQDSSNEFSEWTHVFGYYCSSDSWQGRESDVVHDDGAGNQITVDARGHTILAIMRKLLRRNGPPVSTWLPTAWNTNTCSDPTSDTCLPDLDNADQILMAGTSGGAMGAVQSVDWFVSNLPPGKRVGLVVDASLGMSDDALDDASLQYKEHGSNVQHTLSSYNEDRRNADWAAGGFLNKIDAFIDEDCPTGKPENCTYVNQVLHREVVGVEQSYVNTDTFVRYDLEDSTGLKSFTTHPNSRGVHFLRADGSNTEESDFRAVMHATAEAIYREGSFDEGSVTGLFTPACGQHVGLRVDPATSKDPFMAHLTTETGLDPSQEIEISFHDALWDWWNDGAQDPVATKYMDDAVKVDGYSSCDGTVVP